MRYAEAMRLLVLSAVTVFVGLAMAACELPHSCTMLGCDTEGVVTVDFTFREPGTYRFEVDVDGVLTRCSMKLPLDADENGEGPRPCDRDAVRLQGSGSALPESEHTLGPITIELPRVRHVDVRAFKDEQPVGTSSFDVRYSESEGPNGPSCPPEKCVSATGGTLQ